MKLYTKEMFLQAAEKCEVSMIDAEHIMKYIDEYVTPIELPSDDEIGKGRDENIPIAMAQQTAVEWLVKTLELDTRFNGIMNDVIEQAKAMEKEQKIDFAKHCLNKAKDLDILTSFMNAEQYYNETYKNK